MLLHAAGAAVATRCGQAGNRRGMLSARQRREAWNVEFVQGLTWIYYLCGNRAISYRCYAPAAKADEPMRRRVFIAGLVCTAAINRTEAQQAGKVYRIGIAHPSLNVLFEQMCDWRK